MPFHHGFKSPAEVDQMLDDAGRARVNAIFMQVRRRSDSYYLRTLEVPAQDPAWSPGFDALAYLIDRAHARARGGDVWMSVSSTGARGGSLDPMTSPSSCRASYGYRNRPPHPETGLSWKATTSLPPNSMPTPFHCPSLWAVRYPISLAVTK